MLNICIHFEFERGNFDRSSFEHSKFGLIGGGGVSEHRNRPVSCYYTQALPNRFNLYCACCQSSPTIHLKCSSCSSSMPGASNFPMFCSASNLATSSLCQAAVSRGQTPINPCKPGWVDWGGRCFYMSTGTKNW